MSDTLLTLHSIVRWFVLLSAVLVLVGLIIARNRGGWTDLAQKASLAYVATITVQFVLGVALWISEERWSGGGVFRSWIHPVVMIAAVGLAHAGLSRVRKTDDPEAKNKVASIFFASSFLLVVVFIPWMG
jgi:hypothetical protein